MLKEYLTVGKTDSFEMIEKKSKFIATVAHTRSIDEVQQFIDSVKNRYPDATHHVYAYSTDEPSFLQKYSDDGEPSGTAGLPTMEAIKKNRLNNICIQHGSSGKCQNQFVKLSFSFGKDAFSPPGRDGNCA
jgi:putative IMPACT (imprinted ancient) family translation regulator